MKNVKLLSPISMVYIIKSPIRKQRKFRNKDQNQGESKFLRQISFTTLINVLDDKMEMEKSKTETKLPVDVINLLKINLITKKWPGNEENYNNTDCKQKYLTYTRTNRLRIPKLKPGHDHCKTINLNLIDIGKEFSDNVKISTNLYNQIDSKQKRLSKTMLDINTMIMKSLKQIKFRI